MNRMLRHDPETGELRLLITATWEGKHDRWEFRVLGDDDRTPVRNKPELDGREVSEVRGEPRPYYISNGQYRSYFAVENLAMVDIKTECRRNRRVASLYSTCLSCERFPDAGRGLGLTEPQQCALARLADPHRSIEGVLYSGNGVSAATAQALAKRGLVEFTEGSTARDWGIRRTR